MGHDLMYAGANVHTFNEVSVMFYSTSTFCCLCSIRRGINLSKRTGTKQNTGKSENRTDDSAFGAQHVSGDPPQVVLGRCVCVEDAPPIIIIILLA